MPRQADSWCTIHVQKLKQNTNEHKYLPHLQHFNSKTRMSKSRTLRCRHMEIRRVRCELRCRSIVSRRSRSGSSTRRAADEKIRILCRGMETKTQDFTCYYGWSSRRPNRCRRKLHRDRILTAAQNQNTAAMHQNYRTHQRTTRLIQRVLQLKQWRGFWIRVRLLRAHTSNFIYITETTTVKGAIRAPLETREHHSDSWQSCVARAQQTCATHTALSLQHTFKKLVWIRVNIVFTCPMTCSVWRDVW